MSAPTTPKSLGKRRCLICREYIYEIGGAAYNSSTGTLDLCIYHDESEY